jgi:hypothetical protein
MMAAFTTILQRYYSTCHAGDRPGADTALKALSRIIGGPSWTPDELATAILLSGEPRRPPTATELATTLAKNRELATEKSGPAWEMFLELQNAKSQKEVAEFFARKADELSEKTGRLFQGDIDPFGEAFTEFSGKPEQAIEHLLKERRGHVPGAFYKEGLGDIDLPWGKTGRKGFGLAHIIEHRTKHGYDGEAFVRMLPGIIANGKIIRPSEYESRAYIIDAENKVVLRLDWDDKSHVWLLTAYPMNEVNPSSGRTPDSARNYSTKPTPSVNLDEDNIRQIIAEDKENIQLPDSNGPPVIETLYQPGFHGSPHRFDAFSTDAMGSGEGAQIHGTAKCVKAALYAFQFKQRANRETGVKEGQEIPGDVDPAAMGTMVFFEDAGKNRFVVSGHHRLDLLRRKGQDEEVRAVILRERDGWSTDAARLYGAVLNIREGGGDIDDYIAYFREMRGRLTPEQIEAEGLTRRAVARQGYSIGTFASDNTVALFLNGRISATHAAAMAEAAPNQDAIQEQMIAQGIPTAELEAFGGYAMKLQGEGAMSFRPDGGLQMSLFGGKDEAAALAAMAAESKVATKHALELENKAKAIGNILKSGKAISPRDLMKLGIRAGNEAAATEEILRLAEEADRWRKFYFNPDILAKVQEEAGTAVKPSETFGQDARPAEERIADLYEMTRVIRENNNLFVNIERVNPEIAQQIKEKTGLDTEGYTHVIDGSAIRHTLEKHGEGKETQGDQQPIGKDDFRAIPQVLRNPDNIEYMGKNDAGLDLIRFSKDFNGILYVVEEVRTGRKKLALATMYKKKGLASSTTSETYRHPMPAQRATAPSQQNTISPPPRMSSPRRHSSNPATMAAPTASTGSVWAPSARARGRRSTVQ